MARGRASRSLRAAISSIGTALASAISSLNPFAGGTGGSARQAAPTPGSAGGRYHPSSFIGVPPGGIGTTVHTALYVDGRKMADAVTRHQTAQMEFPTSIGGPDTHGTWMGPGVPLADSA